MTSKLGQTYDEAYVWTWLPDALDPVVAGILTKQGSQLAFNYGRRYLARPDAIALYAPELPLQLGYIPLLPGLSMPSCIRDASPDAWGRRVLINRKLGILTSNASDIELDELTYLLDSGRVTQTARRCAGALWFTTNRRYCVEGALEAPRRTP